MCSVFPSVSGTRTCWDIVVSLIRSSLRLSWIVALVVFPRPPERWTRFLLFSYFFVVTASRGALDAMTDGGLGIAFFAPFDNRRYFFPFRSIKVSYRLRLIDS